MTTQTPTNHRIDVVDALRGFAIMSITLLHNLEHYDFYWTPEHLPAWMKVLDKGIWDTMFFLFSGKSYAIFALLFGLTFFIQMNRQAEKGFDFRGRFLWRLLLLLGFGLINSVFYEGDILTMYATWGVIMVIVCKWSNRAILITSILLLAQPLEWGKFIYLLIHPEYGGPANLSWQYFGQMASYITGDSFAELAKGNFFNGRAAVLLWSWENGRFFQAPALFLMGILLGRYGMFYATERNLKFWKKALTWAAISFIPLFFLKTHLSGMGLTKDQADRLLIIISSWSNFSFMVVLSSGFITLYQKVSFGKILGKLRTIGKMSLTNYISQSIVGSIIYYGFGLGLYQYTGATYALLIGLAIFICQFAFCNWWLKSHKQGPLEYVWHRMTWVGREK